MDTTIPAGGTRLCISHKNIPNMIAQFTSVLGGAKLNIGGMVDQNRGDIAYCMIDVDSKVEQATIDELSKTEGVINVRPIYA